MRELAKLLGILAVILIAIAAILVFFGAWPMWQQPAPAQSGPPPITPAEEQLLKNYPSFQYLISYTDTGFAPSTLTVKQGQTVRFTNNSSRQLWVASIGQGSTQIYPGTSSCGGSAFNSCIVLNPGDFWEFTFDQSGAWEFQNALNKDDTGTVTVE